MKKILQVLLVVGAVFLVSCGQADEMENSDSDAFVQFRGRSMEPTFVDGQVLEVDTEFLSLERGDVVLFKSPNHSPTENRVFRIVGLPGETISFYDGKVMVTNQENPEGMVIDELYLDEGVETFSFGKNLNKFEIPGDGFFVMGDNRGMSTDSRICFLQEIQSCIDGKIPFYITKEDILGVVKD